MKRYAKFLWLLLLVLPIGFTAGATAASFGFRPAERIELTSLGRVTFASTTNVECAMTFSGTLTSNLIPKVNGTQIGSITRATVGTCTGGENPSFGRLPWQITYESITGTLPESVTAVSLAIPPFVFWVEIFGIICHIANPGPRGRMGMQRIGAGTYTTGLFTLSSETTLEGEGGGFCPTSWRAMGTLGLAPTQTMTRL